MALEWIKSKRCAKGDVCPMCRLEGPSGELWRKNLSSIHGYSISVVNFACPKGKPWVKTTCTSCPGEPSP